MSANGNTGTRTLPTILATRSVFGIIPCTSRRNVAWSSDGQCLLVTRQGVTVATPYLATTLPKPELLLDTSMQGGPQKVEDDDDDDEMDVDAESSGHRRLARPPGGELGWWMTAVGFDKGKAREEQYGWTDVGDEFNGLATDRDKERAVRSATWSPSGLSDLGTPFLAVMTTTGQVSVFSPGDDLYTKQFAEFDDLTALTIGLLPENEQKTLTVRGMLRVRATAMEWSAALPLPDMVGIDGSLLAIANRLGGIDFLSCNADRKFARVAEVTLPKPWASDVTWSRWTPSGTECTAKLAIATTDGGVWAVSVTCRADVEAGTWTVEVGTPTVVAPADNRVITALQWIEDKFLVWAKSGSVHLLRDGWEQAKMVRLQRVGNWAGCNALGACVGLHLNGTTLTVVLSTLTYHIIRDATTTPVLAPLADSLRATLAARDVFLDCARRRRRGFYTANDREYTAHTAGWASLGTSGDIVSWMAEPITFHNLDSATEVNRISDFVIADLRTMHERSGTLAAVAAVLAAPPSLLHHSPLGILMPHLLRILVNEDAGGMALCDVVSQLPSPPSVAIPAGAALADPRPLMRALWGSGAPDALRLHLVLAQWGQRMFRNLTIEFGGARDDAERAVHGALARIFLLWAAQVAGDKVAPFDAEYLGHLFALCGEDVPGGTEKLRALAASHSTAEAESAAPAHGHGHGGHRNGACPACGSAVTFGGGSSAFCEKGHEWERCSVTQLLITTPEYRLCTVCPAVSLLPSSLDAMGSDGTDALVRMALQVAVQCLTCGGRWARAV